MQAYRKLKSMLRRNPVTSTAEPVVWEIRQK